MRKKIIFNIPKIVGNEFQNLKKLSNFKQFSGNGYFTKKCSSWLIKNIMCKDALLVHSCTAALEMCAILLNIKPGDEIIMPSYTFVSTANAFVLRGANLSCLVNFYLKPNLCCLSFEEKIDGCLPLTKKK